MKTLETVLVEASEMRLGDVFTWLPPDSASRFWHLFIRFEDEPSGLHVIALRLNVEGIPYEAVTGTWTTGGMVVRL